MGSGADVVDVGCPVVVAVDVMLALSVVLTGVAVVLDVVDVAVGVVVATVVDVEVEADEAAVSGPMQSEPSLVITDNSSTSSTTFRIRRPANDETTRNAL